MTLNKVVFPRMPIDAYSEGEIEQYYNTKSLELIYDDFHWTQKITPTSFGFLTAYLKEGEVYYSPFVHDNMSAKQDYTMWLNDLSKNHIALINSLNLSVEQKNKLRQYRDSFKLVSTIDARDYKLAKENNYHNIIVAQTVSSKNWPEYEAIKNFYGDQYAKRTQIHLMNHIDEGLYILKSIKASTEAQKAFCIHPLYQNDAELKMFFNPNFIRNFSPDALVLALEYRSVANEYLSRRSIHSIEEIRLSPLKEVNDMLVADKIQNYKDFSLYHVGTHPRSRELEQYFNNWFQKLDIKADFYNHIFFNLRHEQFIGKNLIKNEKNAEISLKNFHI